jgi:pimeloyl-ACP methyl ester carboxylesterase
VLLHTSFQHGYAWRRVIPALARRYRVICPDLRGCGRSGAPAGGYAKERLARDVLRMLDVLGIDRAHLAGHSLGGFVGFLVCLTAPGRVISHLALGVAHPWPRVDARFVADLRRGWYQPLIAAPGVGSWTLRNRPGFLEWLMRGTSPCPEAWSDEDLAAYREALRDPARARALSSLYRTFLMRELWPLARGRYRSRRLTTPTLLLLGTRDYFFAPRATAGYEPYASDMAVELVPGAGHFIHEENPELVVDRALELFGSKGR